MEVTAVEQTGDDALAAQPDSVEAFLSQPPTGEPPNPGRRGSAAWEPFLDEDPYEGLEVRRRSSTTTVTKAFTRLSSSCMLVYLCWHTILAWLWTTA